MKKLVEKIKDTLSIFHSSKGFTLLELLVVVVIIGILAAIALPQYKMAVLKSKYNIIKNLTNSIAEAERHYLLANGEYTNSLSALYVDFKDYRKYSCNLVGRRDVNNEPYLVTYCEVDKMMYMLDGNINYRKWCIAGSINETDIYNRLCKEETGDNNPLKRNNLRYEYVYKN